ncbi:MAG: UDP-glucose/GDP-mannose dehydrogenase family protein, partial [Chloroflexota bacterium]|nr:UDP-glucose/GDP-mannose dehydrogenase family protein [Chloroflexota bacterium]
INRGISPIYEEGLGDLLCSCVNGGSLRASTGYEEAENTGITFICVGTYSGSEGGTDLSQIEDAVRNIGTLLSRKQGFHIVAIKSTVAPGTTERMVIPLLEQVSGKKVGKDIGVAVNPEFLEEGRALRCFLKPDRIVIGESDRKTGDILEGLYSGFPAPVIRTGLATAEMIKYAANAFLSTKVSFINEIGNICSKLGIDAYDVADGIGCDPRIGRKFLNAGIGFGGSCLPKDLHKLVATADELGYRPRLLESVIDVNRDQPSRMVEAAEGAIGDLKGKAVAVLGLAFKPDTDDMRDAPSIRVIASLLDKGASVRAYDPKAMEAARRTIDKQIEYCESARQAIDKADCVLIVTEWDEFRDEALYNGRVVIDGRRALDPEKARAICDYYGICW